MSQPILYWNLLLFMSSHSLSLNAQPSSGAKTLIIGQMLNLFPHFVRANSEVYDETTGVHRLARL